MSRKPLLTLLILPFLAACSLDYGYEGFSYVEADTTLVPGADSQGTLTYYDFIHQVDAGGRTALSPTGTSKILVVPVEFSDFPFTTRVQTNLNKVYSSTSEELGYPSVKEFYKASSYGLKDLEVTVTDTVGLGMTLKEAFAEAGSRRLSTYLLNPPEGRNIKPLLSYLDDDIDPKDYDLDGDGYVDGVVMVYSAPDYQEYDYSSMLNSTQNAEMWAYTYFVSNASADVDEPVANLHTWISIDFMDKGRGLTLDPHTFIHEMGHFFGLDDYYSSDVDNDRVPVAESHRTPLGMLDMMDYGLLDHNAFSKFALGWVRPMSVSIPTFVTSDTITVEIDDFVTSGDFLVIPSRYRDYKGHAFDEYILVELYAPVGLNSFDAGRHYQPGYPNGYTMPGIRLYHVDARLRGRGNYASSPVYSTGDALDIDWDSLGRPVNGYFDVAAHNSYSLSNTDGHLPLLHLMEADGTNTFMKKAEGDETTMYGADNSTLFYPDRDHGTFSMSSHKDFFYRHDAEGNALMNRGEEWGYSLRVNGIRRNEDGGYSASLTISKA